MSLSTVASAHSSLVKITRLKDSYTWNVEVGSDSNDLDDLRSAKDKALVISGELAAELRPQRNPVVKEEPEEVPF